MRTVTVSQMRHLDQRAMEEYGIPADQLMERAGMGIVRVIQRCACCRSSEKPPVLILAGMGNNGGDGLVAARILKAMDFPVCVWLAGDASHLRGESPAQFERMRQAGVPARELPLVRDWENELDIPPNAYILVDALLGIGLRDAPQGVMASAIRFINLWAKRRLVVAVDVPSGLNADTGMPMGDTIRADITVTMGLPKAGFLEPSAMEYVGNLEVANIGIPSKFVEQLGPATREVIALCDVRPVISRRPRLSHKGHYGHVLLIGGARGYTGAMALASRAAIRSGAGLVTTLVPAGIASTVAGLCPEVMVHPLPEADDGALTEDALDAWMPRLKEFDAVLAGPGMSRAPRLLHIVRELVREAVGPLVLDADAISLLAQHPEWLRATAQAQVIITPHPGELARLMGTTPDAVQAFRADAAMNAARKTGAVVILKGANTLVASETEPLQYNFTGNPGMATAGSGDVLAGFLAGLLGQGHPPFETACAAVFFHGRAGDMAALRRSQAGMIAGDIVDDIPCALREANGR